MGEERMGECPFIPVTSPVGIGSARHPCIGITVPYRNYPHAPSALGSPGSTLGRRGHIYSLSGWKNSTAPMEQLDNFLLLYHRFPRFILFIPTPPPGRPVRCPDLFFVSPTLRFFRTWTRSVCSVFSRPAFSLFLSLSLSLSLSKETIN